MNKVTIKQVAEAAGVSSMTVSRVLNYRQDVSPATRRQVQLVIDQMGYHPNAVARSLSQGKTHSLGIAVFGLEHYGPSNTIVGVERKAEELGYSMLVALMHTGDARREKQEQILHNLLARQVDGIVWAIAEHEDNRDWLCEQTRELTTPVVFLNMQPRLATSMVAVNNYDGGRQATEHLVKLGCGDCWSRPRTSRPCSPATTRWPWARFRRPAGPVAASLRTWPSSDSTTSRKP